MRVCVRVAGWARGWYAQYIVRISQRPGGAHGSRRLLQRRRTEASNLDTPAQLDTLCVSPCLMDADGWEDSLELPPEVQAVAEAQFTALGELEKALWGRGG